MSEKRSASEWSEFVSGCLDFRPAEGVYRIAREMFTEPELFSLEMEFIFEKSWIYACHESEIPNKNDFLTIRAGRQPLIISRRPVEVLADFELPPQAVSVVHRGNRRTSVKVRTIVDFLVGSGAAHD
ncbi:hypothetical protein P0D88_15245 [Paraburkholderia sp. RL18-103-BIB-C]|jgi:hypothetical protein